MVGFDETCIFLAAQRVSLACHRLSIRWIVGQYQEPLYIGAVEFTVRRRLHRGKESITEIR